MSDQMEEDYKKDQRLTRDLREASELLGEIKETYSLGIPLNTQIAMTIDAMNEKQDQIVRRWD